MFISTRSRTYWVAGKGVDENVAASSPDLGENDEETVELIFVFTEHCLLLGQLVCSSMSAAVPAAIAMPPAPANIESNVGVATPWNVNMLMIIIL